MKKRNISLSVVALLMAVLSLCSCSPDEHELGAQDLTTDDLVEGLAFTITFDDDNPNIVYLTSLLSSSYQVLWEHPQGRTQASSVTLNLPFAGTYTVQMGVETRGGVVYGPETQFTLTTSYMGFVEDEMYTMISGGVGNSKTWVPVSHAYEGLSNAVGEISYADPDANNGSDGSAMGEWTFNWSPDAGYCGDEDYFNSTMTFGLDGDRGAWADIVNTSYGGIVETSGTYLVNTDNDEINFTDVEFLHPTGWQNNTSNWKTGVKIVYLDDNFLQLGILRELATSGEDPWWVIWNFVEKEYADNWVEETATTVDIDLQDDWKDYVEPKTQYQVTYKLSEDLNPFDWADLYGSLYGTSYDAVEGIGELTLAFDHNAGTYTCTTPDGDEISGTYSLSDDGVYTFSDGLPEVTLSANGINVFRASSDNTLQILGIEVDDYTGGLSDIWLGAKDYDDQGNLFQFVAYHFCPYSEGSSSVKNFTGVLNVFDTGWTFYASDNVYVSVDGYYTFTINGSCESIYGIYLDVYKILASYPQLDMTVTDIQVDGVSVDFDDSIIDRCEGDDNTTARRYIVNPWGPTADTASNYAYTSSISVTIHVELETGKDFIQ